MKGEEGVGMKRSVAAKEIGKPSSDIVDYCS